MVERVLCFLFWYSEGAMLFIWYSEGAMLFIWYSEGAVPPTVTNF